MVTGCFGPISIGTLGHFGPILFWAGRFGPILGVGRFGSIFPFVLLTHLILYSFLCFKKFLGFPDLFHAVLMDNTSFSDLIYIF